VKSFRRARLRHGEWLMGIAGLALLVCLFAPPWFGYNATFAPTLASLGLHVQFSGWSSLPLIRFVVLIAGLLGVLGWWLQGTRRAPALPVCVAVLCWGLALVLFILLIVRVLIDPPQVVAAGSGGVNTIEPKWGAYLALALTFVLAGAAYRSLRTDGIASVDGPEPIELLRLSRQAAGSR